MYREISRLAIGPGGEEKNLRVDHPDTTLETVVESTLTTATSEDLGLDNHVIVA
jgi:hypothetical protein